MPPRFANNHTFSALLTLLVATACGVDAHASILVERSRLTLPDSYRSMRALSHYGDGLFIINREPQPRHFAYRFGFPSDDPAADWRGQPFVRPDWSYDDTAPLQFIRIPIDPRGRLLDPPQMVNRAWLESDYSWTRSHSIHGLAYSTKRQSVFLSHVPLSSNKDTHEFDFHDFDPTQPIEPPTGFWSPADWQPEPVLPRSANSPHPTRDVRPSDLRRVLMSPDSMSFDATGDTFYLANTRPARQDGEPANTQQGGPLRIMEYAVPEQGRLSLMREFLYYVDPIHQSNADNRRPATSEIVDIAMMPDGTLLVLERSIRWVTDNRPQPPSYQFPDIIISNDPGIWPETRTRIYAVRIDEDTPTIETTELLMGVEGVTPVEKQLLWEHLSSGETYEDPLDLQGLALGEPTERGWSVIGVTYNRYGHTGDQNIDPTRPSTQLIGFEYVPEPGSAALLLALLVLLPSRAKA